MLFLLKKVSKYLININLHDNVISQIFLSFLIALKYTNSMFYSRTLYISLITWGLVIIKLLLLYFLLCCVFFLCYSSGLFTPDLAFETIVRKQIERMKDPSLTCADLVVEELVQIVHDCALKVGTLCRTNFNYLLLTIGPFGLQAVFDVDPPTIGWLIPQHYWLDSHSMNIISNSWRFVQKMAMEDHNQVFLLIPFQLQATCIDSSG